MPEPNPNSNLNLSKTGLWWCTWVLNWKKTSASQHKLTETHSYCDIYIFIIFLEGKGGAGTHTDSNINKSSLQIHDLQPNSCAPCPLF